MVVQRRKPTRSRNHIQKNQRHSHGKEVRIAKNKRILFAGIRNLKIFRRVVIPWILQNVDDTPFVSIDRQTCLYVILSATPVSK